MGIAEIFRRGVSLVLLLLLVAGLSGCRTKRNLTVREQQTETILDIISTDATHAGSRETWSKILAMCDSLNISFTADSIKTTEGGVIYNPAVTVNAVSPSVDIESTEHEADVDTIHEESEHHLDTSVDNETNDDRDTVVVAKPPGLLWIFTAVIVAAIIMYIVCSRRINKKP